MSQLCAFLAAIWFCFAIDWFKEGYRAAPGVALAGCGFLIYSSWHSA